MISYKYSALSKDGVKVKGVIDAVDEYDAIEKIKSNNSIVLDIEAIKNSSLNSILNAEINPKVKIKPLAVMCSQFAIILNAGTPIDVTIKMIAGQTQDKKLKKILDNVYLDVTHGSSVEAAFRKNAKALPPVFLETLKAGEKSGKLATSFENMQIYFENSFKNKQKLKSATTYPIFVLCVAVVVVIVVMVKVIPTLTSVFAELGGELPMITQVLINVSDWFGKYWMLLLGIIFLLYIVYKVYVSNEDNKIKVAEKSLNIPIIGNINLLTNSQEFACTMSTLLDAGLTVSEALRTTSKCLTNAALSKEIYAMAEKIDTGSSLSETMSNSKYLPLTLKEMCGIGEKSGELVSTLKTIGDYYTNEADYATKAALAKLEPTMLIILAIIAGYIVMAIYLPMFTMYSMM